MKRETFTYVCMWTLLISSLFTTVTKQCLSEACRPRHALFFWRGYSSVSVNLIPVTLAWFVYDCIEPNWASGRASGFSPRAAVRRGQTRPSSGRVFPPSLSSFILTQVKFPFWRTEKKKRRKEEEMNKRLNLAWKTLAHCEPDSGGGKSATLWVKCLGGVSMQVREGWESVEDSFVNFQTCNAWRSVCIYIFSITLGIVKGDHLKQQCN